MVEMVNLLPVNGYQFDFALTPGIVDVLTAIDGTYLMTGGQGGLTAQMSAVGSSGTVIGFDFSGQASIPAGYPGNPSGVEGNLLAVLVLSPDYSGVGAEITASISDFVISGIYNGQNIGLGACDADLNPLNGCFDTSTFSTPTADCAGIPAGDSFVDSCGDCVLESFDSDSDGLADQCDECPYDAENDADGDGICGDVDECPYDPNNDSDNDGQCDDVDPCPDDANDDSDGDGSCDSDDACPYDADDDADGDGVCGDVDQCEGYDDNEDADADGTADGCDACPYDADDDADGDGVCGDVDQCEGYDDNADADADGTADGCDACPYDADDDADGDGVCGDVDQCEGYDDNADVDGDTVADGCDVCNNGDDTVDSDGDGMPDDCDVDITLHEGNNLVSFYALPDDGTDVETFFDGSSVYQIIGQGVSSVINNAGDWVGSLDGISGEDGYWVRAGLDNNEEEHFEVQGSVVAPISHTLSEGSNLLSYTYATTQSLSGAIPAEAADVTFAIVGEGLAAINIGAWVGSLADNETGGLRGGKGYWFTTTLSQDEEVSFEYNAPSGDIDSREVISDLSMPVAPEGFGYTQSTTQAFYFVETADFDGIEPSKGDWIVAYNDNVVVGSWPWTGAYTTVPAMGYDGSESTIGYMESGQLPAFRLFKAEDGSLNDMSVVGNVSVWTNNGAAIVQLSGSTPLPTAVALNEAYPNPFNPSTTISFTVPQDMHVNLSVYDINGRVVAELVNEVRSTDTYNVVWNATSNASGVYFIKLAAGESVHTQKIMLIK
jgi:hypothetical protein